jgi:hypothetical protein
LDASNVFVFGNRTRKRDPSHFNLPVALLKTGKGRSGMGPDRALPSSSSRTARNSLASLGGSGVALEELDAAPIINPSQLFGCRDKAEPLSAEAKPRVNQAQF